MKKDSKITYDSVLAAVKDFEKIIEKAELEIPMIMVDVRKAMRAKKKRWEYQYLLVNRAKVETKIASYKEAIRILKWRANGS